MDELASLWATCFNRPELRTRAGVHRVSTAIQHSYTVHYVYCETLDSAWRDRGVQPASRKLVGAARTISDGHFAAQVLDVCVHEDYRNRGIGVELVKNICTDTRAAGPRSIAVFVAQVRSAISVHVLCPEQAAVVHADCVLGAACVGSIPVCTCLRDKQPHRGL